MGSTSWILRIELPEPDPVAVARLAALLSIRTKPRSTVCGPSTIRVHYATEAEAREAMTLVRAERADARCSVEASPPPGEMIAGIGPDHDAPVDPKGTAACPSCGGTGRSLITAGRPCTSCAGTGTVSAEAAADLSRPLMRESTDEELGGPMDGG